MELVIKEIKPLICLNMIVKDESHIIVDTLTKFLNKVSIDYWVISDTGSTDNTQEIIKTFFKEKGIPGELYEDKWENFAHNRTLALEHAHGKSEYIFVFDADDELCGDFQLPVLTEDAYHIQFGDANGTSYTRVLLVNNNTKKWRYLSVIHEFIDCIDNPHTSGVITGNYYCVSGRSGNRSKDPDKYLKDALVLEKAHAEALAKNDLLYFRYAFYCANSYFDYGKYMDAIKWYKITLGQGNWEQEKYVSCMKLFVCYNILKQPEAGMFYLVKGILYDKTRVEGLFELVQYYCGNDMNELAYMYYGMVKEFYEKEYVKIDGTLNKLFVDISKANFHLPYWMIIVADRIKKYDTGIAMYRIIFTKKFKETNKMLIGNMLFNLQFFIDKIDKNDTQFFTLFKEYVDFLLSLQYPVFDHDFMINYEKYGIVIPKKTIHRPIFTKEECAASNKILFYTGFNDKEWNYSYTKSNALGGAESAVAYLANNFPKNYHVYVTGSVSEETYDNVTYVNFNNLGKLIETNAFHTIIVSRYIGFYEMFPTFSAYQTYIWGHDIVLFPYGSSLSENEILSKWTNKITGCICQTEWHKNLFINQYPSLKEKLCVINNGINIDKFVGPIKAPSLTLQSLIHKTSANAYVFLQKVPNRFIYSSCSERGLQKLLDLWPQIIEYLPDAELYIATYNEFPRDDKERNMEKIIQQYSSITHVGKLEQSKLYELIASAEYWMYPSYFNETSCITSMEMLMYEVICLYYPVAGLINTLGDYGIKISEGSEIDSLLDLTLKKKSELKKKGREYALSCSWKNRATEWCNVLFVNSSISDTPSALSLEYNLKKNIKVINLKKREDRKKAMSEQFERENITNYEFIEAVDGNELQESEELRLLFERNNFNYRRGVIGCALSHVQLWNTLINDNDNEYYVILEDDVELFPGFKEKIDSHSKLFQEKQLEHLSLGVYECNELDQEKIKTSEITIFQKDVYKFWNVTFAYIISKNAAKQMISYINNNSIKCAMDNPCSHGEVILYHHTTNCLVKQKNVNLFGTDIQYDYNHLIFPISNIQNPLKIAYCDWWYEEYCGGNFDVNNNFITDILKKYGDVVEIIVVDPTQNPDVLFYSIFGNEHTKYNNVRRIFFSGEPFGIRAEADFNFTFDKNSDKNTRFPLWLGYMNDYLLEECQRRKSGIINVPKRNRFCSFIANGEVKTTHRRTIIEKLSMYKKVDCGGNYLNNIGYNVPRGINCSGKIEHNNNYKFAIAFENEDYPGYVTEKICDIYKSNSIPIYWGTKEVVKDFNPSTFINARDFNNFDELVEYIIKVDNDDDLYASYFKEPMFSNKWLDAFNDPNKTFYKNLADCIIGKNKNLFDNYLSANKNIDKKKEDWVIYGPSWVYNLIKDFVVNLNIDNNVTYVTNVNEIQIIKPLKILFINNIHDNSVFNSFKNVEISILNIDTLYIPYFLNNIFDMINLYPNIKIYDYNIKNIEVLQKYNIRNELLEYKYDDKEIKYLKEINKQEKIYDFGIICYNKDASCNNRRKYIVELLNNKGYSVNIACGFDKERDIELGKCKIILNIHQKIFNVECRTFEHLRCNRLLYSGIKILSEISYVDENFISKFSNNIKFIKYDNFENITRQNIDDFDFISEKNNEYKYNKNIGIFNIWHNKLFDKCYKDLDEYSLSKITMYDVNPVYEKVYNKEKKYNILKEYELKHYNSLYQDTNYCQTSCLYHIFKNRLHWDYDYIGFIQYDMELASGFIYDMEEKITQCINNEDIYFYSLALANKVEVNYICKPYDKSILEKYNNYFNTEHTYETIKAHNKSDMFICLHTFVIPTKTFIKMMVWYCSITDWLHANYINGLYSESISEITEEIFGLFLLLQMIENDNIKLDTLKLHHEWPNLHNETNFNHYKETSPHFSLAKIVVTNNFTDKNTCHSYLEPYENLLKDKQLTCKNVLEIGIQHGGSMKLWNDYFVNATIYGIDIDEGPNFLKEFNRVNCLKIDAYSQQSIDYFINKNVAFDLIIDDGPHTLESMIYFIINYIQLLNSNGILIVEDIPDIAWCDIFKTHVPNGFTYEIIDLRHVKNRWDDILFVITR
jgi:GR25 family glycosyltransferase involved in LPS biosynthesis